MATSHVPLEAQQAQESLRVAEAAFRPEHVNLAQSLNDLGAIYSAQGKQAEAELWPYGKKPLDPKTSLGPKHPDVAASLTNLATLYLRLREPAEAEPLYKRALTIFEKALGPEDPEVAASLNDLGALYVDQGKYANAEPLLKRFWRFRRRPLGRKTLKWPQA